MAIYCLNIGQELIIDYRAGSFSLKILTYAFWEKRTLVKINISIGHSRVCRNIEITRNQNKLKLKLDKNYISSNKTGRINLFFNIKIFMFSTVFMVR